MRRFFLLITLLWATWCAAAEPELWLYCQMNLLPDANMQKLEALWRRAAAAGYTKVLLADAKFARLGDLRDQEQKYFQHIGQLKKLAQELKLEIVPAGMNIGYSNNMLWHDPNLAEGLPVRRALFEVKGGIARLIPEPAVALKPRPDWYDAALKLTGTTATETGHSENARLVWKLKLSPFRCYHVSVDIRTDNFTGEPEIKPLVGGEQLSFTKLHVARTQDWKTHHIVFGSLSNSEVSLYMGVWGAAQGSLSWRNWKIEEAGPVNILRRPGAPCVVQGYTEGKDYDPIIDPRLGQVPWPGEYEVWHDAPPIRTRLPDGTRLRISWYFPAIVYDEQVGCCLSEPKVYELLQDEVKRLRAAWSPRGIMMSHDELRVLNWDKSCSDRNLKPGAILADNIRRCTALLQGVEAYVWNDMFDPYHNAHDNYFLVHGDMTGSWEGLDPRVTIVNWNFGKRDKSLRFFAGRGHKQVIAGYYDGDVAQIRQWLDSTRGVPGITGVMYTTWEQKYADLETFARLVREWK